MANLIDESRPLLDLIRLKEAEVTKQLAAARERADKEIAAARQQAREMIAQAEGQGRQEGRSQRQVLLDEAECEAQEFVAQAQAWAEALRNISQSQIDTAVKQAVAIVIGED